MGNLKFQEYTRAHIICRSIESIQNIVLVITLEINSCSNPISFNEIYKDTTIHRQLQSYLASDDT